MDRDMLKYFERLEELVERRFSEVKETQADVQRRVGNLEVIAGQQGEQLKYHIKRTDLAEENAKAYREEAQRGIAQVSQKADDVADDLAAKVEATAEKAEHERALLYQRIEDNRVQLDAKIAPLAINHEAKKISNGWIIGALGILLTIASTVAAWLALK